MRPIGEELREPLFRLRNRIRPGDADSVEPMLTRGGDERRLERGRIVQKSRLA
jgi:hypothetical protein